MKVLEEQADNARKKAEEDVREAQEAQVVVDDEEEAPTGKDKVATPKRRPRRTACKASPKNKPETPKRKVKTPEGGLDHGKASPAMTPKTKKTKMSQKYQDSLPTKTKQCAREKGTA